MMPYSFALHQIVFNPLFGNRILFYIIVMLHIRLIFVLLEDNTISRIDLKTICNIYL